MHLFIALTKETVIQYAIRRVKEKKKNLTLYVSCTIGIHCTVGFLFLIIVTVYQSPKIVVLSNKN